MDMIREATEYEPKDFISSMPANVIMNILDRLPLQDAVRTDVLSTNWRFKWTTLSQLIFDEMFYEFLIETENEKSYGKIISRFLLHLNGAITKFVLFVDESCYSVFDVQDINHWVLFLSKKGIKDITLVKRKGALLMLPTHLFSCLELKHLKLVRCCFDPPASFHGFPNLLSLELVRVESESGKLGEFFTRCPMLEILDMTYPYYASIKQAEIEKLTNLKIISLFMGNLGNMMISSRTIFEILDNLPKLQELDLDFTMCKFTEVGAKKVGAKKRYPSIFPSLKTLKLSRINLDNGIELSCVFEMIMSFPNLQTLDITTNWDGNCELTYATCPLEIDYNIMGLQKLQSVVFTYYSASENELSMIKYLLACSPFLKKIVICPHRYTTLLEKFMIARKLLKLYRASPAVDIDLS